jgi:hypothetical protein
LAKTQEQKQEVTDLLAHIASDQNTETAPADDSSNASPAKPTPGITNVWGRAKALECSNGQKRLTVEVDGREMVFDINDLHLVVRNATEGYAHWSCGPLKSAQLTVVYTPQTSADGTNGQHNTDGKALELVF